MDINEKFDLLKKEIETVSELAREYFDSDDFSNQQKTDGSVVTAIDTKIEIILRKFVDEHFPDDTVVGEETETKTGTSEFVWHVDPIDGTDNFLRKIPFCAVSVARLGNTAEDSFAIVHNPITDHTFASLMDDGVYENERLAQLTAEPLGGKYSVSVGRGRSEAWMKPAAQAIRAACEVEFGRGVAYGSTALELAYLAAGRIDGFLTFGLYSYDYAAGLYLIRAAGGSISTFENGIWSEYTGSLKELCSVHGKTIFASHPDVHVRMRDFIGDPERWAP